MATYKGTASQYRGLPPLRSVYNQEDEFDNLRIEQAWALWRGQDAALRAHDRQVEESIRMLAGQQWLGWNEMLGHYQDVSEWFTDDERGWRQRPVFNRLLAWFMLTHSRLTENSPNVGFLAGPDRIDAQLAEAMDTIFKPLWREAGMIDVNDRLHSWLIPAGRAHLQTLIDVTRGRLLPRIGMADVPVFDELDQPLVNERDGTQATVQTKVPLDRDFRPQAIIRGGNLEPTGEPPVFDREGALLVEVLSALQVRGQWGSHIPWHLKRWKEVLTYLPVEEIWEKYNVEVEPDVRGAALGLLEDTGYLEKVIFGSGHYGAASQHAETGQGSGTGKTEGYKKVVTYWAGPREDEGVNGEYAGQQETEQSAGGRLLSVTKDKVLIDMVRPAHFPFGSPIRTFEFVRLPGRPGGSSPQEAMNPIQKSYNRGQAQIAEHTNMVANPVAIYDLTCGLKDGQWTNEPGLKLGLRFRQGIKPIDFLNPPALGQDIWKRMQMLLGELEYYGQLEGARGNVQSQDPSGELVRELRSNSDRPYGSTARRSVEEYARLIQDWMAWIPVVWSEGKILSYAGDDNVARTIVVLPEMFKQGMCDVIPDIESMVPEGQGQRMARVDRLFAAGAFGNPQDPRVRETYFDLARFPNMGRAGKVGGIDRTTAERENAALIQGAPGPEIPLFPWYDDLVHLMVHESFMKSPEYLQVPPEIQAGFALHWEGHYVRAQAKAMAEMQAQAAMQGGGNGGEERGPPQNGAKPGAQVKRVGAGPKPSQPGQEGTPDASS